MWRGSVALVLLPAMAAAQTELLKSHEAFSTSSHDVPLSFRSFNQLRRGTDEKIAIVFEAEGRLTSPRSPVPGIIPLSLELHPTEGIIIGPVDYPKPFKHKFASQRDRIASFEPSFQHMEFKVRAAPDAALGLHWLSGTLTWQVVGDTGVSAPQQREVKIPLIVVERTAKVSRATYWPSQDRIPH